MMLREPPENGKTYVIHDEIGITNMGRPQKQGGGYFSKISNKNAFNC